MTGISVKHLIFQKCKNFQKCKTCINQPQGTGPEHGSPHSVEANEKVLEEMGLHIVGT